MPFIVKSLILCSSPGCISTILFFGTPRVHKGIDDLIQAVSLLSDPDILLFLVGFDNSEYSQNLVKKGKKLLKNRIKIYGLQPFDKVPEIISVSDVVVIPQRNNLATFGQIPAKIFDAMAMAKPVIATTVSSLPEILYGCGYIVNPENFVQLAEKIEFVFKNPEKARKIGKKARKKCIKYYSWNSMDKVLVELFSRYN